MPTVADLLALKGNALHTISPQATALEAVQKMHRHHIGALVVMDGDRLMGMFTERDVLGRIVVEQKTPQNVTVSDVMSKEVITVSADSDIDQASQLMKDRRIRHLPVSGESGDLLGMLSIGDLNAFYSSTQETTITYLQDYIYGRA